MSKNGPEQYHTNRKIIGKTVLIEFHEKGNIVESRVSTGFFFNLTNFEIGDIIFHIKGNICVVIGANDLTKFHKDCAINVTARRRSNSCLNREIGDHLRLFQDSHEFTPNSHEFTPNSRDI
ncbi:hypothetical protein DPMN_170266 [Dreissena polymorpha]|uniref:Uncharacterized protein n=1 Tax=Dreissena polymorpha TaxID=45954 RepID=A0A9D4DZ51_DREPO|nr:hypothetical protein DPMN_170266 [Dreissena polymorpha]